MLRIGQLDQIVRVDFVSVLVHKGWDAAAVGEFRQGQIRGRDIILILETPSAQGIGRTGGKVIDASEIPDPTVIGILDLTLLEDMLMGDRFHPGRCMEINPFVGVDDDAAGNHLLRIGRFPFTRNQQKKEQRREKATHGISQAYLIIST